MRNTWQNEEMTWCFEGIKLYCSTQNQVLPSPELCVLLREQELTG